MARLTPTRHPITRACVLALIGTGCVSGVFGAGRGLARAQHPNRRSVPINQRPPNARPGNGHGQQASPYRQNAPAQQGLRSNPDAQPLRQPGADGPFRSGPAEIVRVHPGSEVYRQPAAAGPYAQNSAAAPEGIRSNDAGRPAYAGPNGDAPGARPGGASASGFEGQHLGQWLDAHRGMPLDQQQRALEAEPGFNRLKPEQQQRLHQRLDQLSRMSPERRQQVINRTEAMEALRPEQRQQVRDAVASVGRLPAYRRGAVVHAFYGLRDMPPAQRQAYMNSTQFRAQFSDQERSTITGLLGVAPIYGPLQGQPHP